MSAQSRAPWGLKASTHLTQSPPHRRAWFEYLATAAIAATAGWVAHGGYDGAESVTHPTPHRSVQSVAANLPPGLQSPFQTPITRHGAGLVSVHADRVPAAWLADELVGGTPAEPAPSPASHEVSTPADPGAETADPVALLEHAEERHRLAALAQAARDGRIVPPERLEQLIRTDPSAQVRLAAFEQHAAELGSVDGQALRAALMRALQLGSPQVQLQARDRLARLDAYEREVVAAADVQPLTE